MGVLNVTVTRAQALDAVKEMEAYITDAEATCGDTERFRYDRTDLKRSPSQWAGRVTEGQLMDIIAAWKASVDRRVGTEARQVR